MNTSPNADNEMPSRKAAWVVGALILALPPIMLAPAWRLWGLSGLEDGLLYYLPQRVWFGQAIARWEWPLWQPDLYGGFPAFADPQVAMYYPPTWLFAILPPQWAYALSICLHHSLAGWLMYRLCRGFRRGRSSALMAGVIMMFCAFLLGHREHMTMHHAAAWTPGVLWAWYRWSLTGQIRHWVVGVLIVAIQLLAGHVQVSLMTAPVAVALVVFSSPGRKRIWLGCLAGYAAAAVICAVQILPAMQLLAQSAERQDFYFVAYNSMLWRSLAMLLFPMLYGQRTPNFYPTAWYAPSHQCEQTLYVTLLAVALAVGAIVLCRRNDRLVRFWMWTGLITLVLALGRHAGVYHLVMLVPVFNVLHTPARWLLIVHIVVLVLASFGADELLGRKNDADRSDRLWRKQIPRGMGAAAGIVLAVLALASVLGRAPWPVSMGPAIWIPLVLLAVTVLVIRRLSSRPSRNGGVVLIGLAVVDLATIAPFLDVSRSGVEAITRSPAGDALRASGFDENAGRVWVVPGDAYRSPRQCLMPDTNLLDGIATLNGYGPMLPTELEAIFGFRPFGVTDQKAYWLDRPARLAGFGVSHVVVRDDELPREDLARRWDLSATVEGNTRIYKNRHASPLWYATDRYRWLDDQDRAVSSLRNSPATAPSRAEVLLTDGPDPEAQVGPGTILSAQVESNSARFEVTSKKGTLLVWLNRPYPGWRASVGDRRAAIYRADVLGQAVFVPPGRHWVTFEFAPKLLEWSTALSLVGLAAVVSIAVLGRTRGRGA